MTSTNDHPAIKHLADDFWNIRGDFRIAKILNVGTHMSLVRRPNGKFLLIDSYELDKEGLEALKALTDGGTQIEAVLNVHPFHTVHCAFVDELLPHARLIGTRRHHRIQPDLQWDKALIEDAATQAEFSDVLDFSIPAGVDFISKDESVHVGSVLVRHRASGIVHVDDTLNAFDLPSLVQKVVGERALRFHPKLADGLEKRAGAAGDYAAWARRLGRDWADSPIVCTAHNSIFKLSGATFADAMTDALAHASDTLSKHHQTYG